MLVLSKRGCPGMATWVYLCPNGVTLVLLRVTPTASHQHLGMETLGQHTCEAKG